MDRIGEGIYYWTRQRLSYALVIAFLFIGNCQQSFQPLKENTQYFFSIYGYLDASADTQWVRISPARGQLNVLPEKPDVEVTLEDLESGKKIIMRDSLFTPGGSPNFINFWTTEAVEQDQTYRLKAERTDGAVSRATVTIPGEFPTPRLRKEMRHFGEPDSFNLFIDDVEYLAEVQTKWYVRLRAPGFEKDRVYSFSHRNTAEKTFGGGYRVPLEPHKEWEEIMSQIFLPALDSEIQVIHQQIHVASGGPEWDAEIASLDDLVYTLPEGFSNIEDGLGYLVGVNSKWIPFESCYTVQSQLIGCPEEEPFW